MTKSQRIQLMATWWPDACAAAGWNPSDRERRLEVFSEAVGRRLDSASDLDNKTDIDRVKAHLLAVSQPDNLDAQLAAHRQPRLRALHRLKELDKKFSTQHPSPYLVAILRDQFGHTTLDRVPTESLIHLCKTLTARSQARKTDPDDMVPF